MRQAHVIIYSCISLCLGWVEGIGNGCSKTMPYLTHYFIVLHLCFAYFCHQEIARILNHPRVYAFLHVPVQSASDSVLMDMKREYCQADFKRVMDVLKER